MQTELPMTTTVRKFSTRVVSDNELNMLESFKFLLQTTQVKWESMPLYYSRKMMLKHT